jgi:alanyl-tRNA synthetase
MTPEEIRQVENIVNEQIEAAQNVSVDVMTVEQATENGAYAFFNEKYGEKVKVYSIGDFSKEVCGGPHVENTKELGHFKITKEQSSSSGIRRIRAVLDDAQRN